MNEQTTLMIDAPLDWTAEPGDPLGRATLPRLLAGIPAHGPMSLDKHLAVHGPAPAHPRRRGRGAAASRR